MMKCFLGIHIDALLESATSYYGLGS